MVVYRPIGLTVNVLFSTEIDASEIYSLIFGEIL